jgi:hypothetical protein
MRLILSTAALVIFSSARFAGAADEVAIKLNRPFKPGDIVVVSTRLEFHQVQSGMVNGRPSERNTDFKAVLEGTETVEAVNAKGGITKRSIKVTKCTRDDQVLVPPGSTLTAENVDGSTEITIDGNDPTPEALEALAELADTARPDDASDDELLGTDKPQKVGNSWPIHPDAVAKVFSSGPLRLNGGQVTGDTRLTDVSGIDGKPSFAVDTTVAVDAPKPDLAEGASFEDVRDLKIAIHATVTLPVDDRSHDSTGRLEFKRSLSFKTDPAGPAFTVSVRLIKDDKVTDPKK